MNRRLAFSIIGLATIAAIPVFAQLSEDLKRKLDDAERSTHVDNLIPVDIAPQSVDPAEVAIRTIRNRLHNSTVTFQSPNCTVAATHRAKNDGCRSVPTLEELPPG